MNKEDILKILEGAKDKNGEIPMRLVRQAFEKLSEPCGDTISRQAAIEVIDAVFPVDPMKSEYAQGIACGAALAKTYVEQLPSAQPEIIRCKDCKFAINADTDMMCGNPKSWVVATENDFGCILAERREQ